MDRLPKQAPGEVPQGDVHTGDGFEPETRGVAAHAHRSVHALPEHADLKRVAACDKRPEQILHDARSGFGADGRFSFTPTNRTGVRFEAYEAAVDGVRVDVPTSLWWWVVGGKRAAATGLAAPTGFAPVGAAQWRGLERKCFESRDTFSHRPPPPARRVTPGPDPRETRHAAGL